MLQNELQVALSAVHSAMTISRAVQGELTLGRWDKSDRTPVTVADLAVQAHISAALAQHFPNDPLMAEESSDELQTPEWAACLEIVTQHVATVRPELTGHGDAKGRVLDWIGRGQQAPDPARRYWVLDPIDGTKGFLRRGQYAIALALIERGKILLGVLACPNLPQRPGKLGQAISANDGMIFFARRDGLGAQAVVAPTGEPFHTDWVPVRVNHADAATATWCERVESSDKNKDLTTIIVERAGVTSAPYRLDSQAKYSVVARGEASIYLRHTLDKTYREKVWDHAAGVIVIEEAGGRVTDLRGQPLDFSLGRELSANRGILATNGILHAPILEAVQAEGLFAE